MPRSAIATTILLLGLAAAAPAGPQLDFARGLYRRAYFDLAVKELKLVVDEARGDVAALDAVLAFQADLAGCFPAELPELRTVELWTGIARRERAILFPVDSDERAMVLRGLHEYWESFIWDTDGTTAGVHAYLEMGRVKRLRGDTKDAFEFLLVAAGVDFRRGGKVDETLRGCVLEALLEIGRLGKAEGGDTRLKAIEIIDGWRRSCPEMGKRRTGILALLELGRAYAAAGDLEGAGEVAVAARDAAEKIGDEPLAKRARAFLARLARLKEADD